MIIRSTQIRSIPSFLLPFQSTYTQTRFLHHSRKAPAIPSPTTFVPDAETFLSLIGRNLSQYAPKIKSWKALFTLTSAELKELVSNKLTPRVYAQSLGETRELLAPYACFYRERSSLMCLFSDNTREWNLLEIENTFLDGVRSFANASMGLEAT